MSNTDELFSTVAEVQRIEVYHKKKSFEETDFILPFYSVTDDLHIARLHQTVSEYLPTSFVCDLYLYNIVQSISDLSWSDKNGFFQMIVTRILSFIRNVGFNLHCTKTVFDFYRTIIMIFTCKRIHGPRQADWNGLQPVAGRSFLLFVIYLDLCYTSLRIYRK